ncbi:hypothetical protein CONLIGDRAFT_698585, partial [Coniochaeta ligniaria NRRL 30616]
SRARNNHQLNKRWPPHFTCLRHSWRRFHSGGGPPVPRKGKLRLKMDFNSRRMPQTRGHDPIPIPENMERELQEDLSVMFPQALKTGLPLSARNPGARLANHRFQAPASRAWDHMTPGHDAWSLTTAASFVCTVDHQSDLGSSFLGRVGAMESSRMTTKLSLHEPEDDRYKITSLTPGRRVIAFSPQSSSACLTLVDPVTANEVSVSYTGVLGTASARSSSNKL